MERIEHIISKAKRSTNTTDIGSISDLLCQDYLNRIQSYLEDTLFLVNDENDLFLKNYEFNLIPGQDEYALPSDIYAKSSIDTIAVSFLNGLSQTFLPLKKVSRKQRGFTFGYFVEESSMVFTPKPMSPLRMKLTYQRKLPSLGIRGAKVSALGVNLFNVSNYITDFEKESDYICIVDQFGNIKAKGLTFSYASNIFTVSDMTGISVGDYVVSGSYATTHSQLPVECEKYMTIALERMISYRQSSSDINVNSVFTEKELEVIKEVFADNSYDDAKPPVTEWQEWLP